MADGSLSGRSALLRPAIDKEEYAGGVGSPAGPTRKNLTWRLLPPGDTVSLGQADAKGRLLRRSTRPQRRRSSVSTGGLPSSSATVGPTHLLLERCNGW